MVTYTEKNALEWLKNPMHRAHICLLYRSEEELKDILKIFVMEGLKKGEKVICISDAHKIQQIIDLLRGKWETEDYIRKGQLKVLTPSDPSLRNGGFSPISMISLLQEEAEKALEEGYKALRVTSDITWIFKDLSESENIIEYESKLNQLSIKKDCIILCQYDINRFPYDLLQEILFIHPYISVGTKLYRNLFYIPPEEYSMSPSKAKLKRYLLGLERQAELINKLIASKKRYQTLVDNTISGIIVLKGPQPRIVFANKAITNSLGLTLEDLISLSPEEIERLIHPEDRKIVLDRFRKRLKGEKTTERYRFRIIRKDGEIRWLDVNATLIEYDGKPAVLAFINDVTEHKVLEERLLRERSLFQALMDGIPDDLYFKDVDSRFIKVNKSYASKMGLKNVDEAIGKTDFDFYNSKFARETYENEQKIIRTGKPLIGKIERIVEKDGTTRWMSITKIPLNDESGKVYGLVGISRDITDLKRYQLMLEALHRHGYELRESRSIEEIAKKTINTIKDVLGYNIISFGVIKDNTIHFIKTTGLKENSLPDMPLDGPGVTVRAVKKGETQIVPDTRKDKDYFWPFKDLPPCRSEIAVPVKVGKAVAALINVESLKTNAFKKQDKEILEILALHVSSAISHTVQVEILNRIVREKTRRLAEHAARLERLNRMKDRFISVATHELRTPLVSIKGYLDLILSGRTGDVPPGILDLLKVIERNAERLRRLTDDLLDVQRIESGRLQLSCEPLDLREVINQSLKEIRPFAEQKNHRLEVKVPENPLPVYGDRIRLNQVLANLLSNSVKFTPPGGKITVEAADKGEHIEVKVTDTGIGISKEDIPKLFKPFPDIKRPIVTQKSTGLGLAICKGIIELHGGKIWAESPGPGKGSTFTFTIPKMEEAGRIG